VPRFHVPHSSRSKIPTGQGTARGLLEPTDIERTLPHVAGLLDPLDGEL